MESKEVSNKRLEILRKAMIERYLTEIDFNSEDERFEAYEKLLIKTIEEGAFDSIFLSPELDGVEESEVHMAFWLAREYRSLCFLYGNISYWADSVEGITNSDYATAAQLLLRNYNYLIRLAKNGGPEVLTFLSKLSRGERYKNSPVIASLLLDFYDEDTLETILIDMAKTNGKYSDFTDAQKIILCGSPDGVLYRKEDESIVILSKDDLKKAIVGDEDYSIKEIGLQEFSEIVGDLYYKYNGTHNIRN